MSVPGGSPTAGDVAAEVTRTLDRLRATTAGVRAEHARWRTTAAARRGEQAAAARRGELGPTARELQSRVDAGLTTWAAVLDGTDTTAAAATARGHVDGWLRARAIMDP